MVLLKFLRKCENWKIEFTGISIIHRSVLKELFIEFNCNYLSTIKIPFKSKRMNNKTFKIGFTIDKKQS